MEQRLRRDLVWGAPAGAALGLAALLAGALWVIPALLLLVAAWWILAGDGRWVLVFLAAALLLPPLPLPGGDSGPHPAVVVAALGLAAGLVRLPAWRLRWGWPWELE